MNLFEVNGLDGSVFDWNNPQNGMSMLYSMRLLYLASRERNEAKRLTQTDIDNAYKNNSFYSHFDSYCSNVRSIINGHKYVDLTIDENYDLRGYNEQGTAMYDGNSIAESLSWTFESLEAYLSLNDGDLDFIKNTQLPTGHVAESFYLSLMYKVLHCFSRRMHLNGIVYNRNIDIYKGFELGFQQPLIYSNVARFLNPPSKTFQQLADQCNTGFGSDLITRINEYNGISPNARINSPFWRYIIGYSNDGNTERLLRTLYSYTRRGGGSTLDYYGGIIDFKINNLCSTSDGLFYGQVAKNDWTYKAWIAGDNYSDSGWYDLQSVDGKYSNYEFYSDAGFLYKKIQDLPLSVNDEGFYTTNEISMRSTEYNSFEEITEPEQYKQEGLSVQVMPYGDINDEYYSDFITEDSN